MTDKKPAELSDEALIKNEKNMRMVIPLFSGILIVLFGTAIFLTVKKGFSALVVTPIAFMPLLIIFLKNQKELKAEIKRRGL